MTAKTFAIADVLSVSTGILLPNPEHEAPIDAIYGVMNHLSGQSLMTHHLAFLHSNAVETLHEQHPFLRDLKAPERSDQHTDEQYLALLEEWCNQVAAQHGGQLTLHTDPERFTGVGVMDGIPEHMKVIPIVADEN